MISFQNIEHILLEIGIIEDMETWTWEPVFFMKHNTWEGLDITLVGQNMEERFNHWGGDGTEMW